MEVCVAGSDQCHVFKESWGQLLKQPPRQLNHIDFHEINYVQNKVGMAHACAPNAFGADKGHCYEFEARLSPRLALALEQNPDTEQKVR